MQKLQFQNKKAFTLAEVLITLAVIGVVAALTIPLLLNNTNESELKTKWKKTYASFSNATNLITLENGGSVKNFYSTAEQVKDVYKQKLLVQKDCSGDGGNVLRGGTGLGATLEGCWHDNNEWKYLNGTFRGDEPGPGLVLADGTFVHFYLVSASCTSTIGDFTNRCGSIMFDVNGFKGPNTIGIDIFHTFFGENYLVPNGARNTTNIDTSCIKGSTAGTNTGYGCSAKYLYE